ncbi:MAG TPA: murein L,D-transpeptidase catalytic domain family protein [Chitinophagaceae bacterium]
MRRPRNLIILFVLILSVSWFTSSGFWKRIKANNSIYTETEYHPVNAEVEKLKKKSTEAISYIKKYGYNESICFFIDMTLPSGQNRFFVYDVAKDSIQRSGLVTHGRCNQLWLEGRKYSNEPGCGCSSLGKYRIGNSYYGKFGLAYKLYGLDKTNNNAFKRFVVLHSHECVPENEVTDDICQSDGCPTVSPQFLQKLKPVIDHSPKPILLWIFD